MLTPLFLIPTLPLVSSLLLGLAGRKLSRPSVAVIGTASVAFSTLLAFWLGASFWASSSQSPAFSQILWTWMQVGTFRPEIALRLDSLSLVMTAVVSFVSFLILLYSVEFMAEEEGYSRFFAYMNLFVASMLTLVLADDLLLLYLGWEGVGLCSYLLIGFWYKDPANGRAARKAFLVTRIGDTGMAIGLFLLYTRLGTLEIQPLLQQAQIQWQPGSSLAIAAAALLLAGAVGKSAQLPLQTWLPDAMAGPTPVSALIHAATMVTAGVYLIARMHSLFELAPTVLRLVAIIGAVTLLISAFSALIQSDIKRVLAYSTISQIGYMFLALGVGAWSAAIFHFMTHAFFKALLFLSAGAVILSIHHEHNIFKMGGLRKQIPGVFWCFLIGAASLSALPWITAGFYSKGLILSETYGSPMGSPWLWSAGLMGAFLSSLYSFRLVFIVFFGKSRASVHPKTRALIMIPLAILALLSLVGGLLDLPAFLDQFFTRLSPAESTDIPFWLPWVESLASLGGIVVAYVLYFLRPQLPAYARERGPVSALRWLWFSGWGFDWLYDFVFVRPYLFLTSVSRNDAIDLLFDGIAWLTRALNRLLTLTQTGKVRWYATVIAGGAAILIALAEVL